ncbi:hypothetical protein GJR96_12845 [Haloferax sp. MBLA0076]|uniref:Uncharacterized protein n=1 Tax=Haloferax litoreum TaxID=2666140 RepID=A0A6A8GHJ0_9EURY|nr:MULTISPECIES: hypothetical protein [Haloferax]KAB1194273.1 hypothetical protein Hfx1148_12785 [Haloferax sp. CBA1148]MRX22834.1 hypothetical protein [Haloferax litoreum]
MTRNETRDGTAERMGDISHTNPYTGETFTTVYERGPAATDGGEVAGTTPEMTGGSETMEDVDHTPRNGADASEVWKRGRDDGPARTVSGDVDE